MQYNSEFFKQVIRKQIFFLYDMNKFYKTPNIFVT